MSKPSTGPSTYEWWKYLAEKEPAAPPVRLSLAQIRRLDAAERKAYRRQRRTWHESILLRTPDVIRANEQLDDLLEANEDAVNRVRAAAAMDAPPSLGKSTTVEAYGLRYHREQIEELGEYVDDSEDIMRIPVCRITLTGDVTIKGLHQQLFEFYAHPARRGTTGRILARDLATMAGDAVRRHETRLIIIDDVHFLHPGTENGEKVANELKWLANEYPATFLFAGVALKQRGLFSEGLNGQSAALAQTGRRWTLLRLDAFDPLTATGASVWRDTLLGIEKRLVLARMRPGTLADKLSDYLYIRSTGVIGSLMHLIRLGAIRAIRTGHETLDVDLLDQIPIDEAAEAARGATAKLVNNARRTTLT